MELYWAKQQWTVTQTFIEASAAAQGFKLAISVEKRFIDREGFNRFMPSPSETIHIFPDPPSDNRTYTTRQIWVTERKG